MSWQPEEVAHNLASLLTMATSISTSTSASPTCVVPCCALLQTGWSERHVPQLRAMYGANVVSSASCNDLGSNYHHSSSSIKRIIQQTLAWIQPVLQALAGQLKEPLILMLLGSAGLSILLGNVADAISIAVALLIVSAVAAIQEYRSEQALEQLQHLVPQTCTVLRDGMVRDHGPACELVVGDLVLLQTGDRVPADCRVVDALELELDESPLTGEQHPVSKTGRGVFVPPPLQHHQHHDQHHQYPALTDQSNIVFAGTLVNAGRGRAVVVAVGRQTEFGKVASELSAVVTRKSPMQIKIDELSQRLAALSTAAIVMIAVSGWLLGRPFLETLTVAVSLAVAAIPEGLPICVTVTLALGVLRMARRNAIVKKLPVVESLGCATAVASDKTGTLTQNESTSAWRSYVFGF